MIPLDTNIRSPFKFLDAYKKKDVHSYFGRNQESLALFELYKDSSIMILHGPSGSGKTSLIYCGLLNKIKKGKKIISIRRDDNLIETIKKKLFIDNDKNNITNKPSELLDNFFSCHSDLNRILASINETERMMLEVEEDIIELKHNKRKVVLNLSEQLDHKNDINEQDVELTRVKYKERLNTFIVERKELLVELREKNNQVTTISSKVQDYFMNNRLKKSNNLFAPLIIFDQFEELFVYGNKEEIKKFGLFLKLIFEHKIPFNIIISLREEYFGHLDQLQSFVPQIFYKKIRLAHPSKEKIKSIIEKSFQEFNINQYVAGTKEKLRDEDKENRIELILDQIRIKDNDSTSYHLPFLQVYLDRLYKMDYYKTYGSSSQNEDRYPPLEFREDEIKEFGSIEQVLDNYIREVNSKIIRNTSNKLNNKVEHKDSIIKFLRHFKTKDDLKKRIPIRTEKENYYVITNKKIAHKIQTDIWGTINEEEYSNTISEIINELKQKGILNVSSDQNLSADYAELSHDIIARVISKIRIEDDFRSLIRKDFFSSFDIYEDTKDKGDLLSTQQIDRMNQCLDFVMNDDNVDRLQRKQEFLKSSVEESQKEERKNKKQKQMLKWFFIYPFIVTLLLLFLATLTFSLQKSKKENEIKELLSYALRTYNVDKTSSLNYVRKSEEIRNQTKLLYFFPFHSKFDLLDEFKNDLYKDYRKMPFYHSSINFREYEELASNDKIISTKTRRFPADSSMIYVFASTEKKNMMVRSLNYKTRNAKSSFIFKMDSVIAFEPFESSEKIQNRLMTLIAQKSPNNTLKLKVIDTDGNEEKNIHIDRNVSFKTKIDIEYQEKTSNYYSFIIGIDKEIIKLTFDLNNKGYQISPIDILNDTIRKIKKFKGNKSNYLILYGKNKLYHMKGNIGSDNVLESKEIKDRIHAFHIKKDSLIFLGLKGRIKELSLDSKKVKNHYVHDELINTIAVNEKDQMLISSHDNGANLLMSSGKYVTLLKQFMGHKDPIHNVSFVKKDNNYIITSGEDQTIKIWNIAPVEETVSDVSTTSLNKYTPEKIEDSLILETRKAYLRNSIDTSKRNVSGYINNIRDIDFSIDSTYIVSGSSDNSAIIWKKLDSTYEYDSIQTLTSHTSDIIDVEFNDNDMFLTASSDNTVQIYKKRQEKNFIYEYFRKDKKEFIQVPSLIRHNESIKSATFSSDGQCITVHIEEVNKKNDIYKEWGFGSFDDNIENRAMHQNTEIKMENDGIIQTITSWFF